MTSIKDINLEKISFTDLKENQNMKGNYLSFMNYDNKFGRFKVKLRDVTFPFGADNKYMGTENAGGRFNLPINMSSEDMDKFVQIDNMVKEYGLKHLKVILGKKYDKEDMKYNVKLFDGIFNSFISSSVNRETKEADGKYRSLKSSIRKVFNSNKYEVEYMDHSTKEKIELDASNMSEYIPPKSKGIVVYITCVGIKYSSTTNTFGATWKVTGLRVDKSTIEVQDFNISDDEDENENYNDGESDNDSIDSLDFDEKVNIQEKPAKKGKVKN